MHRPGMHHSDNQTWFKLLQSVQAPNKPFHYGMTAHHQEPTSGLNYKKKHAARHPCSQHSQHWPLLSSVCASRPAASQCLLLKSCTVCVCRRVHPVSIHRQGAGEVGACQKQCFRIRQKRTMMRGKRSERMQAFRQGCQCTDLVADGLQCRELCGLHASSCVLVYLV